MQSILGALQRTVDLGHNLERVKATINPARNAAHASGATRWKKIFWDASTANDHPPRVNGFCLAGMGIRIGSFLAHKLLGPRPAAHDN